MGGGRHIGVIAWHCNPTGRGSAVLPLLLNDCRRQLALIQTGYTELLFFSFSFFPLLFLNEDERTKEKMGKCKLLKRALLRSTCSVAAW